MSWLLDRLLMWIADVLDRSLVTVPELGDDWPRSNGRTCAANTLSSSAPIKLGRGSSVLAARSTPHRKAPQ